MRQSAALRSRHLGRDGADAAPCHQLAANMRESTRVVGQALERQGQALERQGQAMTRAFTQQGQALALQREVLAELLRHPA